MGYLVTYLADDASCRRLCGAKENPHVKSCTLNPLQIDALRGPALGSLLGIGARMDWKCTGQSEYQRLIKLIGFMPWHLPQQ